MSLLIPKSYQQNAIDRTNEIRSPGRSTLVVAPPGAGKSFVMMMMAEQERQRSGRALIKVHRTMLLEQMIRVFEEDGYRVGVIAPNYQFDPSSDVIIASTATLYSRYVRRGKIDWPECTRIINDEAHQQTGLTERALAFGAISDGMLQHGYMSRGIDLVGFTATPIMGQRIYTNLVQMVQYSQLRAEGMHQEIITYGPSELDVEGLKANSDGDYSEKDLEPRAQRIFGNVFDEWKRLNPDALPAILFAPSVECSKWFAYQYVAKGVPSGHIDGEVILMPGTTGKLEVFPATQENRDELLRRSKTGEIKILCNRFVLREAIDMPWLYHGIFATVFGSRASALQSVGRLQRCFSAYEHKILQDHGGFYWRHGDPNSDRTWRLGLTGKDAIKERVERLSKGEELEGLCCPKCGRWRPAGPVCLNPDCRHAHSQSVRRIQMESGKLKLLTGAVYQQENNQQRALKLWKQCMFRGARSGMTVGAVVQMAKDEAARRGIQIDFKTIAWAPPAFNSPDWHRKIANLHPWLLIKKKPQSGGSLVGEQGLKK